MTDLDDAHISVRFRYGIHTIYLFVDALAPIAAVTTELLSLLQERYPEGLRPSLYTPTTTQFPADAKLAYGVLKVPNDITRGWKRLKTNEGQTSPTKMGIKDNSVVAFTIVEDDDDDTEVDFEVEWPRDDQEELEQEE